MTWRVVTGDCIDVLRTIEEASIDAVVTDPPYGIGFMGHEWDQPGVETRAGPGAWDQPPAAGRTAPRSRGSMEAGKYDRSLSANRRFQAWCEAWGAEVLRVLKPGGHAVVFGSPRTYHRLAAGLEDAGFEIRDTIVWLFGSGFPKSLNLTGEHEGWGTALKPGMEPITLARKPLASTVAATVAEHGTGALHIDACRIPGAPETPGSTPPTVNGNRQTHGRMVRSEYSVPAGRWPANVVLDAAAGAMLDEQTGVLISGSAAEGGHRRNTDKTRTVYGRFEGQLVEGDVLYGDRGGPRGSSTALRPTRPSGTPGSTICLWWPRRRGPAGRPTPAPSSRRVRSTRRATSTRR